MEEEIKTELASASGSTAAATTATAPEVEDPQTFERIKAKLDEMQISYRLTTHVPV